MTTSPTDDGSDFAALKLLRERGFKEKAGNISPPTEGHVLEADELAAIHYLFSEWDYCYGEPV